MELTIIAEKVISLISDDIKPRSFKKNLPLKIFLVFILFTFLIRENPLEKSKCHIYVAKLKIVFPPRFSGK